MIVRRLDLNNTIWSSGKFIGPSTRRRFAVGDIHGYCKTLRKLLEEVLLLKPDDTLYLLGDYIDRGPESKGVLDRLLRSDLKSVYSHSKRIFKPSTLANFGLIFY